MGKDLAELVGCCTGKAIWGEAIPSDITAITLVALGTSLPDTLASKTAAESDENADNSIGNVTGSNSVNVFLGLGLPWTIAAIYWELQGEKFKVEAGNLAYSVGVFSGCACATLGVVYLRGMFLTPKAELGGKYAYITTVFLVSLWILYLVLSILKDSQ